MTNGLFSLFSSLIANTPPYRKGLSSRRRTTLFFLLLFAISNIWGEDYLINVESSNLSNDSKWYEVESVGGVTNKTGSTWSSADYECTPTGAKTGSSNFTIRTDKDNTTEIKVNVSSTSKRTISSVKTSTSLSSFSEATNCTPNGTVTKNTCDQVLTFTFNPAINAGTYVNIAVSGNLNVHAVTITTTSACTETAPTSVAVSGGATYDKGDALSNLSAAVTGGTGTMSYQWYCNTTNAATVDKEHKIDDATSATLAPYNKVGTRYYYCVVSNCAGSVTSGTTAVTINPVCPPSGTIYKFQVKTGLTNGNLVTSVPKDVDMTTDNYLSALVGGELMAAARNNVNRINITGGNAIGFASGADAYLEMTLDCAIQAGDIIKYTVASNNMLLRLTSATTAENELTLDRTKTQVEVPAAFVGATKLYMIRASSSPNISYFEVFRPVYRTITLEYADGVTPDGSLEVVDGEAATRPADPTWEHHRFDGWYNGENPYDWSANVTDDLTLTARWTQLYTISFAAGEGGSGDAPAAIADKAAGETFTVPANTFTAPAGSVFDNWSDGVNTYDPEDTYTVGTANIVLTANWRGLSTLYAITEGTHMNGSITISPASQEAGETVTLTATPDADYLFSAWEVVKTEDGTDAGVTVTNGEFTMPGYPVTVNATFVADTRKKVLYVTNNNETATKENDKLYDALKNIYNVSIVGPASDAGQSGYDLVVLHESVGGGSFNAAAVAAAKTGSTPVLNTKSYFYNDGRFGWGTPNAGKTIKGATLNSAYCNIASHPLFAGVTVSDGFFEITNDAAAKCMQPIGSFVAGKEGYTLATTPNNDSGEGCAIHELTPAQRGASAGKYLMISVSNDKLNALNANGQKLFQNAAAYLIDGSASWTPVAVPTSPVVAATPTENYTEGGTITLTASAEGTSASAVYTWYKGADWATASATTPVQAASTSGATFSKTAAVEDAGTYWCNISNGTSCDAQASVTITVSSASTPTHTISYDNVMGADMTAYPTEYTEGIGVVSFDPLADITGWHFVEWSPASIATDATTDQTITAVWAQVFEVTFNLQGYGAEIAKQDIISGEKATEPTAPSAIGYDFGGWFTDAACTAGNEFDFDTPITAATPLYAKWTAFDGCFLFVPKLVSTEESITAGSYLETTLGGKLSATNGTFSYNPLGLLVAGNSSTYVTVTLDNNLAEGTKITILLAAGGTTERGLNLRAATDGGNIYQMKWTPSAVGEEKEFEYTVNSESALKDKNVFYLYRNNNVYIKSIKVTNCGGKIVSVNYAISPAEAVDKATVTLSANKSVEGQTITATYSSIASGWDFDKWEVNGDATMDDAQANPVTITMGAENPTVTLVLKPGAIKHTVSFNTHGGSTIDPVQVVDGQKLAAAPADPTKEDYIFKGWAETADGAAVDVTSFAITADKEFHAIWTPDGAIKLLNGATVNHTNFITGVTAEKVTIGEVEYDCVKFGGTVSGVNGVKDLTRVIAYNATTNQTKIKLSLYNTSTSSRTVQVKGLVEGADAAVDLAAIELGNKEQKASDWIEFNNEANRTIYIFISSSAGDVRFLQVKVIESGATTLKKAGEAGYSLNFNKGRFFGLAKKAIAFEGLNTTISSDYQPLNSSYARFNATNMNFTTASPVLLRLTTNNNKTYYVTNTAEGTDNVTEKTGVSEFNLTAGTWYINAAASEVQFTKIEFLAPKCDAPVFNALSSSDICSGESYVALDGTATITDGGTVTYKWYAEGGTEVLAETKTYTPTADGSYYVVATNSLAGYTDNVVQSEVVFVTTHSSAAITTAPENVRMDAGKTATLAVVATGKAPLTYQWYTCDADGNNATEIGATTASYEVTVGTGVQYYKVVVSSDCGTPVEAVVKVEEWTELPLADVTSAITWDFSKAVTAETTLPSGDAEIVLANVAGVALNGEFESNKLKVAGTRLRTTYIQAKKLMFHATIPGKVTIEFSNTGNKDYDRILYVNGVETTAKSKNQDHVTYSIVVPAGDVVIQAWEKAAQPEDETWNLLNIYSLSFSMADYIRTGLTVGSLGTICLPSNVPAGYAFGATFYELKGKEPQYGKIVFDEILSDELVAGKPYLFQAQSDVLYCFYGTENVTTPDNSGAMKGTFVNLKLTDLTNIYYFAQKALWSCVDLTSLSVPANRAYVKMDEMPAITESNPAPGVRRITLGVNGQQVATGVDQVQGDEAPTKMIINGQLFILRGEKMYDAQGKLVK